MTLILLLCMFLFSPAGTITYLEGNVQIQSSSGSGSAKFAQVLDSDDIIILGERSMVEIRWDSGVKTTLMDPRLYRVRDIYVNAPVEEKGVFDTFKKVFASNTTQVTRAQEGGIRRSEVDTIPKKDPTQQYWKIEKEVKYESGAELYFNGDYKGSIIVFKRLLSQNPFHPQAKYILFALGHCYVEIGNYMEARRCFTELIQDYGTYDDVGKAGAQILERL